VIRQSASTAPSYLKPRQADALGKFVRLIEELSTLKDHCIVEILRHVLERTDYFGLKAPKRKSRGRAAAGDDRAANDVVPADSDSAESVAPDAIDERRENVEELITAAHQFDLANPGGTLDQFLSESVLATDLDEWDESRSAVSLMTLHAAKGLEFPAVFIVAVEQNILPHSRSKNDSNEVEEERRLLFVGMTRAKEELYLSHVERREFRGQTATAIPSQFLMELPSSAASEPRVARPRAPAARGRLMTGAELAGESSGLVAERCDLAQGMLVRHPIYGLGRVTELSGYGPGRKATIRFTVGDSRTFVLNRSKLSPVKV
jgi:DNA helicase-2/ATP-dependent DNA helicase PcrA